jgi:hypothetical protein
MDTAFYVLTPSFFSQVVNGTLIIIFLYILFTNFNTFLKTDFIKQLQSIGILAIAFGIHGSLHLGLEQAYSYNPLLFLFN